VVLDLGTQVPSCGWEYPEIRIRFDLADEAEREITRWRQTPSIPLENGNEEFPEIRDGGTSPPSRLNLEFQTRAELLTF